MNLRNHGSEIFVPDGTAHEEALARTTHLAIAAHQDDIEILGASAIVECYRNPSKWFSGVVVTDGRGSPRSDTYTSYTDEEMREVRKIEQKNAATLGEYAAQVLLDYPSNVVKSGKDPNCVKDLIDILYSTKPEVVLTHNLADKHDTHVATVLRVLEAARQLPETHRPARILGCEVWRDLDWMSDTAKIALDCSKHENLQVALLGAFDSQISGGKRYDLAAMGRRRAHATFFTSHETDKATGLVFAMDLTPIMCATHSQIIQFTQDMIRSFENEVLDRLKRLS